MVYKTKGEAHKGESCDVARKRGEMEDSCDAGSLLLVGSDIMFLSPHSSADCVRGVVLNLCPCTLQENKYRIDRKAPPS